MLRYKNYNNFHNRILEKEKVFLINNFGHLNHLKDLFKNSKKYIITKKDDLWIIANKENFESEIKKDKLTNEVFSKKFY